MAKDKMVSLAEIVIETKKEYDKFSQKHGCYSSLIDTALLVLLATTHGGVTIQEVLIKDNARLEKKVNRLKDQVKKLKKKVGLLTDESY